MPVRLICHALALLVLAVAGSGCSSMTINTDRDPQAEFSELKTYQWVTSPTTQSGDPRIANNALLDSRVKSAVDRVLGQKGYQRLTNGGDPDFLVAYHATLDQKAQATTINEYYGYAPGWIGYDYGSALSGPPGARTYVYEYDEGTLLLDVVNPDTHKLMWRGSAIDRVNFKASPEAKEKKINEAVSKMLKGFPPK